MSSSSHSPQPKRALGKGLSALIAEARSPNQPVAEPARPGAAVLKLPIEAVRPDHHQPRKEFADQALDELARSIQHQGLLQPVLVRRDGKGFRLIAGERRWRAAQRAGLLEIPAIVREANDAEAFELALVENLQREDLKPLESAEGYRRLMQERKWTQEQVADRVGKDRSSVANLLRLLHLPAEVKDLLGSGAIDMGHARALLGLTQKADITALAQEVVDEKLSVRETERRVRLGRPSSAKKKPAHRESWRSRSRIPACSRR
jgi:ParB family chromosome partitioning protein